MPLKLTDELMDSLTDNVVCKVVETGKEYEYVDPEGETFVNGRWIPYRLVKFLNKSPMALLQKSLNTAGKWAVDKNTVKWTEEEGQGQVVFSFVATKDKKAYKFQFKDGAKAFNHISGNYKTMEEAKSDLSLLFEIVFSNFDLGTLEDRTKLLDEIARTKLLDAIR